MGVWKNIRNGFMSLVNLVRLRQNKVVPFHVSNNDFNENQPTDGMPMVVNKPLMRFKAKNSISYILPNSDFIRPFGASKNAPILPISDPELEIIHI